MNKFRERVMEYYLTYREDTLQHFGTRGMKWGRRQYQYQDGSYTPEGKLRYGIGDGRSYNGTHKSSTSTNQKNTLSKKKSLTKKQKIMVGLGATAAVGTVLAVYGAHKYSKIRKENIAKHKRDVDEFLKDLETASVTDFEFSKQTFETAKVDTVNYNTHLQSNLNELRKYAAGMK